MPTRTLFVAYCLLLCVPRPDNAQGSPSSYDTPMETPAAALAAQELAAESDARTNVEPDHTYTLAELVDLAEQHNPATRIAWEQARAQADRLRIARSELFPALTAVMMMNTARNGILFNSSFVRQTMGSYEPMLQVNYLVLDFGARESRIAVAREQLLSAGFSFNRVHLDVLFNTSRLYYEFLNAIGQRDASKVNFDNADAVSKAVEARLAVGLATLPDELEARAAAAQANFALQAAIGQVDITRGKLLSSLGASPLGQIQVQSLAELKLPNQLDVDVDGDVKRAFSQRPEIGIQVAARDTDKSEIRAARSAFLPQLQFAGEGGDMRQYGQQDQLGAIYRGPSEQWNVSLNLQWSLFAGGRRGAELALAHADERRAVANIDQARDEVEQQVWTAYVNARTAFYERDAAGSLLTAAQVSYNAALTSYQLGLRNTVDVVTAQRTLAQALSSDVSARTDVLLQLANLAYRTGDLLQVAARKRHP